MKSLFKRIALITCITTLSSASYVLADVDTGADTDAGAGVITDTGAVTDAVTFNTIPLSDSLYMLQGKGGNIALSVGEDGLLLVDDDYNDVYQPMREAIRAIDSRPVNFVINTHWHFDHVGGNEPLGKEKAIIIAQNKVRDRLLTGGVIPAFEAKIPPAEPVALPVITFKENLSLHWNGEEITVEHFGPSAHTDGDSAVFFEKENVLHAGDLYFSGMYPFIDASSGGSLLGVIEQLDKLLGRIDDETRIIPGHGPLSVKANLIQTRDMLVTVYKRLSGFKNRDLTTEQVIARKPTLEFDAIWGNGFLKPDTWVGIVYNTL